MSPLSIFTSPNERPPMSMSALSTWQDTPVKQAILDFVAAVTDESSPDFVPVEQRIATFDNDGTLWSEQPAIQGVFIMERLAEMAERTPLLRSQQPWKAAYEKDYNWVNAVMAKHYQGDDSGVEILLAGVSQAFDMTVDEFNERVQRFFDEARHPKFGVSYLQMTFVPMVELLQFLADHGFTCYIVSGGGRDFIRPVTQQLYGIPPERVIGTAPKTEFVVDEQGARLIRKGEIAIFDEGAVKPIQIWDRAGYPPILAVGNANGDIPMLQYATQRPGVRGLGLLVQHDDCKRDTSYRAGADEARIAADENGWFIVSVLLDWKQVYSFQ